MSLSFIGIADHQHGAAVNDLTLGVGAALPFDLLLIVLGFEGVAAGSGPWVTPNTNSSSPDMGPAHGWKQVLEQSPGATGCGLEVWAAILTSGSSTKVDFDAAYNVQGLMAIYRGEFYDSGPVYINGGAIRGAVSKQVTGDNPDCPSVYSFVDEILIAIGADTLSGGWGTPTPAGWTSRADYSRAGAGTVEITLADKPTTVEGDTGAIPFSAAASPGGAHGATATLSARPTSPPPTATSPLIAVEFAVAN